MFCIIIIIILILEEEEEGRIRLLFLRAIGKRRLHISEARIERLIERFSGSAADPIPPPDVKYYCYNL